MPIDFFNNIGGNQSASVPNPEFLGGLAHKSNWQGLMAQQDASDAYAQKYAELKNNEFENALKQQAQIADYRKQLDEAPLLDIHRNEILKTEKNLQKPFDDLLAKYNGNVGDALSSREGRMAAMQYMNGLQNAITPEMRQAAALKKQYTDAELQGKSIIPAFDKNNTPLTSWQQVEDAYNAGDKGVLQTLGGAMKFNKNDLYQQVEKRIPEYNSNLETPQQYLQKLDSWKKGMPLTQDARQSAIEVMAQNGRPYNPNNRQSQALFDMFKNQFDQQPANYSRYDNSKDEALALRKEQFQGLQEQREFQRQQAADKAAEKSKSIFGDFIPDNSVDLIMQGKASGKETKANVNAPKLALATSKPLSITTDESFTPNQQAQQRNGNITTWGGVGINTKHGVTHSIVGDITGVVGFPTYNKDGVVISTRLMAEIVDKKKGGQVNYVPLVKASSAIENAYGKTAKQMAEQYYSQDDMAQRYLPLDQDFGKMANQGNAPTATPQANQGQTNQAPAQAPQTQGGQTYQSKSGIKFTVTNE